MRWFKMFHEARNDAKLRSLTAEQFRVWFNLLCYAADQEPRGVISGKTLRLIAVEVTDGQREALVEACEVFRDLRMIDFDFADENAPTLSFRNFDRRQNGRSLEMVDESGKGKARDDSADRVRRYRARQKAKREGTQPPIDALTAADVESLRAMSYEDYLATEHWKKVREYAIRASGGRCSLCNAPSRLQAHHRTYENLGEERPRDVITLCESCHETFHANGKLARPEH